METSAPVQVRTRSKIQEEKQWNRIHDLMEYFHSIFKSSFDEIYAMADGSFAQRGISVKLYLQRVEDLSKYLFAHHKIEETHLFPILAKKMPAFQNDDEHLKSHHDIHEGLDKLRSLIDKWRADPDPNAYESEEMIACLDSWKDVLYEHLDQEVQDLSGENMKKYWTLEEVEAINLG